MSSCRIIPAGRLADVNSRTGKFITRFQAKPRAVAPSFYIKMFANTSFFSLQAKSTAKVVMERISVHSASVTRGTKPEYTMYFVCLLAYF